MVSTEDFSKRSHGEGEDKQKRRKILQRTRKKNPESEKGMMELKREVIA